MKWMRPLRRLAFLVTALSTSTAGAAPSPADPLVRAVVADNTAFAIDLYGQLRRSPGNLFFSPASISTTLAMALAGARGETAAEMTRTLRSSLPPARRDSAFAHLLASWNAPAAGGSTGSPDRPSPASPELLAANRLWCQAGMGLAPAFVATTRDQYGAPVAQLDFQASAEPARVTINDWVAAQTHDEIAELLAPGSIDPSTRLILTNALYFRGAWGSPFDGPTAPAPFFSDRGRGHDVPMMRQELTTGYTAADGVQVLELPYAHEDPAKAFSLVIVLPDDRSGLPRVEARLAADELTSWLDGLRRERVAVSLPRFRLSATFELGGVLEAMGMQQAFRDGADFSGITTAAPLKISSVVHEAFVDVDEKGTEAAAATAVTIVAYGAAIHPPPRVFRADHPFLVILRDQTTGSVLFLGRVVDPGA